MARLRCLVSDPLGDDGIRILEEGGEIEVLVETKLDRAQLKARLNEVDAVVIRSGTTITADLLEGNTRLKVIGRAGIGVDNVDVPAATAAGIVVMNTPGGNAVTTAEHTIALMLAAARRIPQAHMKLAAGVWDRKSFVGTELAGKTLGVVGLGNIGSIVADRAKGLKMKVIGYDPFVTPERAAQLGVELAELDEVIANCDVLTLHVPLTDKTRGLINEASLKTMRKGAIIVNCARGGIIDEPALAAALESGHISAAALDVFAEEPPAPDNPLLRAPNVVYTPHLGASTAEAQAKVALAIAEQVRAFLLHGEISNAVNAPNVSQDVLAQLGPYLTLGEKLGRFVVQLHEGTVNKITVRFDGDIANLDSKPVVAKALKGILHFVVDEPANEVNATQLAQQRGIEVEVQKSATAEDFTSSLLIRLEGPGGVTQATGVVFGKRDPRIVRVNNFLMEALTASGPLIVVTNRDVPGVIGHIGTTLGNAKVNINQMYVGRTDAANDVALTVIAIDHPVDKALIGQLAALNDILTVRQVDL